MQPSKYSFEIWSPAGNLLADLNGRALRRRVTVTRNDADDIAWTMNLNDLERYATASETTPSALLASGINEVRVKRGHKYIAGGKISYVNPQLDAQNQIVDIRASGFLNLFKDRYTDAPLVTFTSVERTTIASQLILNAQNVQYGSFGITIGLTPTLGNYSRQYQNVSIKDALVQLTQLQTSMDIEFTPDKVFNMYSKIGSNRPELVFEYPGNVTRLQAPLDATGIANKIYLLGSGIGQQTTQTEADDASSQKDYVVREKNVILSDVLDSGTLTDYGNAQLAAWSRPFMIPTITYNANQAPYVTDYTIGDYVKVLVKGYELTREISGMFRIEKIDLSVDEDDNESVTLSLSR